MSVDLLYLHFCLNTLYDAIFVNNDAINSLNHYNWTFLITNDVLIWKYLTLNCVSTEVLKTVSVEGFQLFHVWNPPETISTIKTLSDRKCCGMPKANFNNEIFDF